MRDRSRKDGARVRRLVIECVGTALLSVLVIGAGLLAERFPGQLPLGADALIALTGGLAVALLMVASGARFNPALTLADAIDAREDLEPAAWIAGVQIIGAVAGVAAAHAAFDMGAIQHAGRPMSGVPVWLGAFAAAFVFVLTVGLAARWGRVVMVFAAHLHSCRHLQPKRSRSIMAFAAGVALALVYLATPALSLANPALLIARTLTDSYLGIRPADAPVLLLCQLAGAVLAGLACSRLAKARRPREAH